VEGNGYTVAPAMRDVRKRPLDNARCPPCGQLHTELTPRVA
jgi:hypothetical protein